MFSSLSDTLDSLDIQVNRKKEMFLITETPQLSGNAFLIHFLLKASSENKIIFLALQNSWSHYCNVANKFGVNLRKKVEDEDIKLFELNKEISKLFHTEDSIFSSNDSSEICYKLFNYINDNINHLGNSNLITIIVDSVMPLVYLGMDCDNICLLVQYFLSYSNTNTVLSCAVDNCDPISVLLSNSLKYKCSSLLSVKNLETGRSKSIDGELKIWKGLRPNFFDRRCSTFHFKFQERDVKIFAPGLASTCL